MREPKTAKEQMLINRFESIVAKEINSLDPIGLLKNGAPVKEYSKEIRDITLRLWMTQGEWLALSEIMYVVFAYSFTLKEAQPQSQYLLPAQNIMVKYLEAKNG